MRVNNPSRPYVPGQSVPQNADDFRRWLSEELQRIATAIAQLADGSAYVGSGAPTFAARKGATYSRTDGGAGTSFYVNETGAAGGWVGK